MALTGLILKTNEAAAAIDYGRKGFATRGKAEEGRLSYERGISWALSAFKDAQSTADSYIIILIEYTFLNQELQFCDETDKEGINSLTEAIHRFDDAFLALEIVADSSLYKAAEKTYSKKKDFRVNGFPKDGFHVAVAGHQTRIKNILRAPGIDPIEKALLKQRLANMSYRSEKLCCETGEGVKSQITIVRNHDKILLKIQALCKNSSLSIVNFLEMRHAKL